MGQREKSAAFRQMHREPPILVLPNAWDVASAKQLAAIEGCRALATSSAAVARSLGYEDGERAPGPLMVEAAGRIARAIDLPVTGDLERGYGDPVGTALAAWDAGLVGINFEDSTRAGLVDVDEQVAAIRAIREAVPDLVINARVDIFVRIGSGDVAEAAERGNAYLEAGADCVYPILAPVASIEALAHRIRGPINVIAEPETPPPAELQELGVARLTWGSNLAAAAYAEAVRIATSALA
ncbi:MAG TPA: isocitrate lyase/phosphoenolpyruvate mutase family protein [Gaiellaceae bacterium]|nr:isocitrate lyase/phosphoenolpyruvate mutase family protein [Gaiellaceae bacterium]